VPVDIEIINNNVGINLVWPNQDCKAPVDHQSMEPFLRWRIWKVTDLWRSRTKRNK